MVTEYGEYGSLRSCLKSRQTISQSPFAKINFVRILTKGLADTHADQILRHDFHSGNALIGRNSNGYAVTVISDLGLSGPANTFLGDKSIHSVIPHIAPEVIRGNLYTDKADIYSLDMHA